MGSDDMNMNMNMNMNMAAFSPSSVAPSRVRFNTADYRKLAPPAPAVIVRWPAPAFPANWDPDLRSYVYANEFVLGNVGFQAALGAVLGQRPVATQAVLDAQVRLMLDVSPDREDRFAEIIDQHDAEGAISYFLGMLAIDPARHPMTYLLVRAARRIGEMVAMVLKQSPAGLAPVPRPSQASPIVVPMIDPPVTPSFPSGHSLQARLIALSLEALRPGDAIRTGLLDYLADRIGQNRIIAGLHYPLDHAAGVSVANALFPMLNNAANDPLFAALVAAATAE